MPCTSKQPFPLLCWFTYNTSVHWVLAHAHNVPETPAQGLSARGVVGWCLSGLADAEDTDDAPPRRLLQRRRINVVVRPTSNKDAVRAGLGNENGTRRMSAGVGHAADDDLSGPDSTLLVVIGKGSDTGKVAREQSLAIRTEIDAVVC